MNPPPRWPVSIGDLRAIVLAERGRWPLFLPVFLGAGIGLYFGLGTEPPGWLGGVGVGVAALACVGLRRAGGWLAAAIALLTITIGFAAAEFRTARVEAPILVKRLGPVSVEGQIAEIESRTNGFRIVLERLTIDRLDASETPERIRLRITDPERALAVGGWVSLRAILLPPPPPTAPGAFDFQRLAFFQGLGAVGFAVSRAAPIAPPAGAERGLTGRFDLWLEGVRADVFRRVTAVLPGATGAIAAALLTGQQGAIPEDVIKAMRDSGLAHLLAISGQNISLVAGFVFLFVRAMGALIPPLALRYPLKKWAAVASFASAVAYLLLSGASVPTQRSVAMIGLVLLAILLDRSAISMRSLAWAACLVLLVAPESLLGPSFQMSFAAVMALIAGYELLPGGLRAWAHQGVGSWFSRPLRYLGAVVLSSILAITATAPFAVYHFNRFSTYALLANVAAVPLTDAWIMLWALGVLVLLPFGLEALALPPMGWGIDAMISVAKTVAALPGAAVSLPRWPVEGLVLVSLGGLWLCLWRRQWRALGLLPIAAGIATAFFVRTPDILVSEDGKLVAVQAPGGELVLSSARGNRFSRERWLLQAGQEAELPWTMRASGEEPAEERDWLRCDSLGCLYRPHGRLVAIVFEPEALAEDCARAELVVSAVPARRACRGALRVVDRFDLWREGAHAIWLRGDGGVRIETVRANQGERPWVPKREPKRQRGAAARAAPPEAGEETQ
jgi:competence protein ComEC